MSGGHNHAPASADKLRTAFALTFAILAVELVGGLLSHSLALLSDAGHVLTDVVALGLAWFATLQAQRPADAKKTYGYHRVGILAALLNAVTLVLIVGWIGFEAVQRLHDPSPVTPALMFVSAAIGIAINLYIGFGLRGSGEENVNVRAALLHVFGDVAASVGVIVAGIVIITTRWYAADAIISLAIAVLIAKGAWNVLLETLDILMESTPKDVNVAQLVRDIIKMLGVSDVHDLHVWSITGGMHSLSAHLQIESNRALSECDALLEQINELLSGRYRIAHSTIQFECANCDPHRTGLYCGVEVEHDPHDHAHDSAADAAHATEAMR